MCLFFFRFKINQLVKISIRPFACLVLRTACQYNLFLLPIGCSCSCSLPLLTWYPWELWGGPLLTLPASRRKVPGFDFGYHPNHIFFSGAHSRHLLVWLLASSPLSLARILALYCALHLLYTLPVIIKISAVRKKQAVRRQNHCSRCYCRY